MATKWNRVGPGVYDSADGVYTMYRIEGVNPPAWNIEYTTAYAWAHTTGPTVVDGAASMADAKAIFEQNNPDHQEA